MNWRQSMSFNVSLTVICILCSEFILLKLIRLSLSFASASICKWYSISINHEHTFQVPCVRFSSHAIIYINRDCKKTNKLSEQRINPLQMCMGCGRSSETMTYWQNWSDRHAIAENCVSAQCYIHIIIVFTSTLNGQPVVETEIFYGLGIRRSTIFLSSFRMFAASIKKNYLWTTAFVCIRTCVAYCNLKWFEMHIGNGSTVICIEMSNFMQSSQIEPVFHSLFRCRCGNQTTTTDACMTNGLGHYEHLFISLICNIFQIMGYNTLEGAQSVFTPPYCNKPLRNRVH